MAQDPVVHLHLPVDASTGKLLYKHGDEVRNPQGFPKIDYKTTVIFAVEFLNRELSADLFWNLTAHPLDTGKVYALSGGCDRNADASPMFFSKAEGFNLPGDWLDGSDPDPVLGRLTFRIMIDDEYFAAIAGNGTLREFCSITVITGSGSDSAVLARIPFHPRKRADESAGGSGGNPADTLTTLNGLSGAVVLADANGDSLPTDGQVITIPSGNGSELFPDPNPIARIPVLDATLGICHYFDSTFPEISFAYPVWKLREIRALVRSINPAVTGTVDIDLRVDGVSVDRATINVGADWGAVTIPLVAETGSIRLVRTGGTLDDGGWITAAFRGITAMVAL